ncbi:MAG TPA: GntR family transcriptional regulator [Clostridia bacterium]|nr:GntR family transcriptional regulator [Clostridia bacterium]
MKIEFDEKRPIYLQIMKAIKQEIATANLKGGDKLPSVREMAEILKVNPNTVQRAYQELEREQITYTQRGMGTFITNDVQKLKSLKKEMATELVTSFVNEIKNLGFSSDEIIEIVKESLEREVK